MIPKTIHYCWFGGKQIPPKYQKYIEGWKKVCPEFCIKQWNESNFDFSNNSFMKKAYDAKKWGFVTDVARLEIIYNEGGIYLDTDVEIVRNFDDLLMYDSFFGFESDEFINTGIGFGAVAKNKLVYNLLQMYDTIDFNPDDLDTITCPIQNSKGLEKAGFKMNGEFQIIDNSVLLPIEFFGPMDYSTGKIKTTENTHGIHHYEGSWMSKTSLSKIYFTRLLRRCLGMRYDSLKKIMRGGVKPTLDISSCSASYQLPIKFIRVNWYYERGLAA